MGVRKIFRFLKYYGVAIFWAALAIRSSLQHSMLPKLHAFIFFSSSSLKPLSPILIIKTKFTTLLSTRTKLILNALIFYFESFLTSTNSLYLEIITYFSPLFAIGVSLKKCCFRYIKVSPVICIKVF